MNFEHYQKHKFLKHSKIHKLKRIFDEPQSVFEFLSMSRLQNLEHYQKSLISEAIKNAFIFCELKQAGYTKSIFEVLIFIYRPMFPLASF